VNQVSINIYMLHTNVHTSLSRHFVVNNGGKDLPLGTSKSNSRTKNFKVRRFWY